MALFNILEERDVQIRGYRIRLPLDLLLVATANPEDYTHRGRIVSPLKDRFGTQVRTHYPETLGDEIVIMDQEAKRPAGQVPVRVPAFMKEILAALTAELRRSPQVNQRSGVSVRYSIGNLETLAAAAVRRAARAREQEAVPRVCDLPAALDASLGRVEFDTIEEGREGDILLRAMRNAELEVFRRRLAGFDFQPILSRFSEGFSAESSDLMAAGEFLGQFGDLPGLAKLLGRLGVEEESPGVAAAALEFALEGLHLSRRLNKDAAVRHRRRVRSLHALGVRGLDREARSGAVVLALAGGAAGDDRHPDRGRRDPGGHPRDPRPARPALRLRVRASHHRAGHRPRHGSRHGARPVEGLRRGRLHLLRAHVACPDDRVGDRVELLHFFGRALACRRCAPATPAGTDPRIRSAPTSTPATSSMPCPRRSCPGPERTPRCAA